MPRPEKVAVVEALREKLAGAEAAVLTEYRGLSVAELAQLRSALRATGTQYTVYKNTLARRAAEEAGLGELVGLLVGPTAFAFVDGDLAGAARALRDFSRTHEALTLKGGLLGGRLLTPADLEELARLPSRPELLARVAGGFKAPLLKAAGLLQGLQRKTAYAVKALIDQRVEAGEAAQA